MRTALAVGFAVLAAVAAPLLWLLFVVTPAVRGDIVSMLAERYGQDVELGSLGWRLRPNLALHGERVVVGAAGGGTRPLLTVERFDVDASIRELLGSPRRIRRVTLAGLVIVIPPRGAPGPHPQPVVSTPDPDAATSSPAPTRPPAPPDASAPPLVVDTIVADRTRLEIERRDKPPRVFEIPTLTLAQLSPAEPLVFDAVVVNPTPPGTVQAHGTFGPWHRASPRDTPIAGDYTFAHGDLSVFKGLAGKLDAAGTFGGSLDALSVTGRAQVPTFAVSIGQAVALDSTFTAIIGERGGDIGLQPVLTTFGSSTLRAEGSVERAADGPGRVVDLHVISDDAHIEDVLRLALKAATPPMAGPLQLDTRLLIPPGDRPMTERLRASGTFALPRARFRNINVQKTLERISRFTRRDSESEAGGSVVSNLSGAFEIAEGVLRFERLQFDVPGFGVRLAGSYALDAERLDLAGRLVVARRPSDVVGGAASRWIGVAESLLGGREGGVTLPIAIRGPRTRPSFSVDRGALGQDLKGNLRQLLETPTRRVPPAAAR